MKTSLKNKDSFTRSLDVTIPWSSLKDEYVKEFNNQKKKFKMPGFRPGKVPQNIVKKEIGPAVEANFAELSLNKYYQQALMELKIIPINQTFRESVDGLKFDTYKEYLLQKYVKVVKNENNELIVIETGAGLEFDIPEGEQEKFIVDGSKYSYFVT